MASTIKYKRHAYNLLERMGMNPFSELFSQLSKNCESPLVELLCHILPNLHPVTSKKSCSSRPRALIPIMCPDLFEAILEVLSAIVNSFSDISVLVR